MVRKNLIAAPLWAENYQKSLHVFYNDGDNRKY